MRRLIILCAAALVACGPKPAAPSPEAVAVRAAAAAPADSHLAALYGDACRACHGQPGTGAPMTLDAAAWAPRWAKGEEALLAHTISGFNGMPAGGQCFACTPDDYRALIRFMAGQEK